MKPFVILILVTLISPSRSGVFNAVEMYTLGRTQTSLCNSECFDYFSYSTFYSIYGSNGYCCKRSYAFFAPECVVSSTLATSSSKNYQVDELKYTLCTRDTGLCGADTNLTTTTSYTTIEATGFKYGDDTFCYYQINLLAQESALYDLVEIKVEYFFASTLYIINGASADTATNKTTAQIGYTYLIPTLTSSKSINTIWIVSKPDTANTQDTQLKFKYRFYSDATGISVSSSLDITLTDEGNTIRLSVKDFALICAFGGAGAIGVSILLAWIFTWLQHKLCPPQDYVDEMKAIDELHKQKSPKKVRKSDYDNTYNDDDEKMTTPPKPKTIKKKVNKK